MCLMLTSRHVEGGCKCCGAMTGDPRVPVAGGENSVNVPNSYALDDYANNLHAHKGATPDLSLGRDPI